MLVRADTQAPRFTGTVDEAAALFAESLALNRRLGARGMVLVELHNLGHVELRRGHVDAAERLFAESAQLGASPGAVDPYDAAMLLFNQAAVAFARGDRVRAAALLREARSTVAAATVVLATDDADEFDQLAKKLEGPQRDP